MDKWLRIGVQLGAACLVAHLFGYLVPTLMFIYYFWKAVCYFLAAMLGMYLGVQPKPYLIQTFRKKPNENIVTKTKEKLADMKFSAGKIKNTPLISRNVDDVIDELISLLLRDYVTSWYSPLVPQPSLFCKQLKDPIRQMLFTFRDRCREINDLQLFSNDFVVVITEHLQNIRCAVINPAENIQPYKIAKFLADKESELDHLRSLCGFLLVTVLPPEYVKHKQLLILLREVFTNTVFYPVIDKVCDPDFINLKLVSYLKQKIMQVEKRRHTYEYAETYEDFIKLIQECTDVEELQRMRYYIATEIMQSITISNLKRSKGIDADKEFSPQNTSKGDLLQARNLPRYSNQLRFARNQCEKRLRYIGGPAYVSSLKGSSHSSSKSAYMPGQKVLSMSVIMQSSFCRRYFSQFLQKEEMHSLLGFWEGVEDMKKSDKDQWHKLGYDIVQIYVNNDSSSVKLNRNTLKGIEEFMMANKGPEAFFQGQTEVYKTLESNYYASFIVSDIYHKMLSDVDRKGIDFMQEIPDEIEDDMETSIEDVEEAKMNETSEVSLFDHSSYARSQLKIITERLNDKKQALQALRSNPKYEKKGVGMLETEIENLIQEQNLLENHIEKTELWIVYLGTWQASIMEAMEKKENDKIIPYFVIRVHLASDAEFIPNKMAGWVVSRSLNSFHSLHQKLVPAASWLKKLDLPTKPIFKTFDRNYLEKAKHSLQFFLSAVTKDDGLNKSEALYEFLSPSPEYMKHPPCPPKKQWKFSILQFLKGVQNTLTPFDDAEEEELLFLDDSDREEKKDPIAEPLYALIGEIFTLKGGFNWLRRSLIVFIQVAYGQSINRQLQKTVSYIMSEPMLLFYLQLFRETMWPTGQQPPQTTERTQKDMLNTKIMAKQMFVNNTPIVLYKLVGQQSARKGMSKIFDALQNKNSNKQLLYKMIEVFIYQYAPELKRITSLYNIEKKNSE